MQRAAGRGKAESAECIESFESRVVRGELDTPIAQAALDLILGLDIEICEELGLPARAMTLARQLGRPSTYDCHYVALAEHHHCEFWTGDQRYHHAAKDAISGCDESATTRRVPTLLRANEPLDPPAI